jgi:hypothetical protein
VNGRHRLLAAAAALGVALGATGGGGCSPLGTRGTAHCPHGQHAVYKRHWTQDDTWRCVQDRGHRPVRPE